MRVKELREKKRDELVRLLREAREELTRLKLGRKTGASADGSTVTKKRREIAQISTVSREKEILQEGE